LKLIIVQSSQTPSISVLYTDEVTQQNPQRQKEYTVRWRIIQKISKGI